MAGVRENVTRYTVVESSETLPESANPDRPSVNFGYSVEENKKEKNLSLFIR